MKFNSKTTLIGIALLALFGCKPDNQQNTSASATSTPIVAASSVNNTQASAASEAKSASDVIKQAVQNGIPSVPMTEEQLNEVYDKISLAKDKNGLLVALSSVVISDAANQYIENIFQSRPDIAAQISDKDDETIVKKMLAFDFYQSQITLKNNGENMINSELKEQLAAAEKEIQQNIKKSPVEDKYDVAETQREKEVLAKIKERFKSSSSLKTVNNGEHKINAVQEIGKYGLFGVYINNSPTAMVVNKNVDYFIVQSADESRYNTNMLYDEHVEHVKPNSEKERAIYRDYVSHLKPLISKKFGNGKRNIYVFTDVDCPFCLQQDQELLNGFTDEDNVTINYIFNPITELHPTSNLKTAHLLCLPNPTEEYIQMQKNNGSLREFDPKVFKPEVYGGNDIKSCMVKTQTDKIFSEILGLNMTPVTIVDNGIILYNKQSIQQIRQALRSK